VLREAFHGTRRFEEFPRQRGRARDCSIKRTSMVVGERGELLVVSPS